MKGNPDMDSSQGHNAEKYIDELLNSFVDGELTFRQQTEVKRLMSNDSRIAQRVQQLQRCKILIGSMPHTKAPDHILAGVTASLLSKALLAEQLPSSEGRLGTRRLFARKVLSAVAMISMVAVLSIVIYTIVAPRANIESPIISSNSNIESSASPDVIIPDVIPARPEFHGRLELNTANLMAVNAFIARAIEDNGLSNQTSPIPGQDRRVYNLTCSREDMNVLLFNLEYVWTEFESAKLFVETETFGKPVVVEAVNTKQVAEIVNQDSVDKTVAMAKDYAVFNSMTESIPGQDFMTAINDRSLPPMRIPQPRITGGESKTNNKSKERADEKQTVHLTIVVDR